mgnify:CR=1 FL=1
MNDNHETAGPAAQSVDQSRHQAPAMRPAADIFEDDSGITLQANMPGVSKDRLEIKIDNDTLTIEGRLELAMTEGMQALHADVRGSRYQRSFSLSSELDTEKTEASLRDGVLILRIPKRAQYKPRKIQVRVD